MEKPARRRSVTLRTAALVLLALLVLYPPFRVRMAREEPLPERCAPGTSLGIFFTSGLSGYREPCG